MKPFEFKAESFVKDLRQLWTFPEETCEFEAESLVENLKQLRTLGNEAFEAESLLEDLKPLRASLRASANETEVLRSESVPACILNISVTKMSVTEIGNINRVCFQSIHHVAETAIGWGHRYELMEDVAREIEAQIIEDDDYIWCYCSGMSSVNATGHSESDEC